MRLNLKQWICVSVVASWVVHWPAPAAAGRWFLAPELAIGSSTPSYKLPESSRALDSKTVFRQSLAAGREVAPGLTGAIEVAFVQRGGTDRVRTVFRPNGGREMSFDRSYVDVGTSVSFQVRRGLLRVGVGACPRVSFLVAAHDTYSIAHYDKSPLIGLDPVVTVGCGSLYLRSRYLLDLVSPRETSSSASGVKMSDEVIFFGLGYDFAM